MRTVASAIRLPSPLHGSQDAVAQTPALEKAGGPGRWLGTAFAISHAMFEIPAGYKGDRVGARAVAEQRPVVVGVYWWIKLR